MASWWTTTPSPQIWRNGHFGRRKSFSQVVLAAVDHCAKRAFDFGAAVGLAQWSETGQGVQRNELAFD
jgi:hypothetical protein